MKRDTAKLLKVAQTVFGALVLHPELGPADSVSIWTGSAHLSVVSARALLAWHDHIDEATFRSHGSPDRWFAAVDGVLHGMKISVSTVFESREGIALLSAEPMSLLVLRRLQNVPQQADTSRHGCPA